MKFKNHHMYTTIAPEPVYTSLDFILDLIDENDPTLVETEELDIAFIKNEDREFNDLVKHEPQRRN